MPRGKQIVAVELDATADCGLPYIVLLLFDFDNVPLEKLMTVNWMWRHPHWDH